MADSISTVLQGMVNAYLIQSGPKFFLIDTGMPSHRKRLVAALEAADCHPGDLELIIVTHGDPDHSGNAAHLREIYGAKIAMHRLEAPSVESGDMFLSRSRLSFVRRLLKPLMGLFRLRRRDRFSPDLTLDDGDDLGPFGFDATVLHVPGHSIGSIAVLTAEGALFSGDFLENRRRPSIATLVDDKDALVREFQRIRELDIRSVYPGHGKPFTLGEIAW